MPCHAYHTYAAGEKDKAGKSDQLQVGAVKAIHLLQTKIHIMGAWSTAHFDNDIAMDWIYDFSLDPSVAMLEAAFNGVIKNKGYIESDDGAIVLAAAEVIAARKGKKSNAWPEDIPVFTDLRIGDALTASALQAIEIVCYGDESELKDLWQESDEFDKWLKAVEDVKRRLL
jgi:Domain of unknown function (DUF4259)